jgi:hypothetical protein
MAFEEGEEKESIRLEERLASTIADLTIGIPRGPKNTILFNVSFLDGYVFRQQFEYLRQAVQCAPLVFDANGISIIRGNDSGSLVTSSRFYANKLVVYEYAATTPNYTVNVNLQDFNNQIKSLAKRSGLQIYQFAEYPEMVVCKFSCGPNGSDGTVVLKTEPFEPRSYVIQDGVRPDARPNAKTSLAAFCVACNDLERGRFLCGIFRCTPNSVTLSAANQTETSTRVAHWGTLSRINVEGQTTSTNVPIAVIRILKKMNGWGMGVISMYGTEGIIRLQTSIGCFGDNTTYLLEPEQR